jgi:hypothetical protein
MSVRRIPFTAGMITLLTLIGLVTGAMFTRVADLPWGADLAYGLPAFTDGRLWTLGTGAFFAVTPLCYVAVLGSFAVLAGFAEVRLGTYRAVLACLYGHLAGVLGAALLVALVPGTPGTTPSTSAYRPAPWPPRRSPRSRCPAPGDWSPGSPCSPTASPHSCCSASSPTSST